MWTRLAPLGVILLVGATGLASAQESKPTEDKTQTEVKKKADEIRERLSRALRLPETVATSREAGVDERKVKEVLETARGRELPAGETQQILEAENEELKRGGNPENFGAAVQQMKASGLRGRELAQAIHAEQIARGMKKPKRDRGPGGKHAESPSGRVDEETNRAREAAEREKVKALKDKPKNKPKSKPKSKGPKKPKGKP